MPLNKPEYHGAKNDMFVSYKLVYISDNNKTTPSRTFITTTTTTPVSEAKAKAEKKKKKMNRNRWIDQNRWNKNCDKGT